MFNDLFNTGTNYATSYGARNGGEDYSVTFNADGSVSCVADAQIQNAVDKVFAEL